MDDTDRSKVKISLAGSAQAGRGLPAPLRTASRGVGREGDPFINERCLRTREVVDLSRRARDVAVEKTVIEVAADSLLVLETEDGFSLIVRADKLRDDIERVDPSLLGAEGVIELDAVGNRGGSRGLGDWLFSRLSVVDLAGDEMADRALAKAREWAGGKALEWAEVATTWAGTKALMWAIESRLERQPGLYRWLPGATGDGLWAVSAAQLGADAAAGPLLVFVHGTASSTNGSFDDLHAHAAADDWSALARRFGRRIYALEHRTFSESPIDNALALAEALPAGARVNLVSHSRGGLVADLLCIAAPGDDLLSAYRRRYPRLAEEDAAAADRHDVEQLGRLAARLAEKQLVVERYVRVASPARGTRLASANLDVFLSGLLSLVGRLTPLAGSLLYSAFKRIVLEIAHNRTDPALVPGIEAMLPESPLAAFLARVERRSGIRMAVIAGDIEGGGLIKRLGVLFTDHVFFDAQDNDLVVDTDSMYQGVARAGDSYAIFEQGPDVNHFRYFTNTRSRRALRRWLTAPASAEVEEFEPIAARGTLLAGERAAASRGGGGVDTVSGTRPVVVVLPGIMGSHLETRLATQSPGNGDRIWFDFFDLVGGGLDDIAWERPRVEPESLFERFYGELCEHLSNTHDVLRFAYDWRKPVADEADRLAADLHTTLDNTDQPVRILAHSMGGLVARAAFAREPALWEAIAGRDGGRFVMLGTPNNGSHLMVEMLLGKGDTVRSLARIDVSHDLQQIIDIVAGFRGALALLPRPGFDDTGGTRYADYFEQGVWNELKPMMRDFWFGNRIAAQPGSAALSEAAALWRETLPDNAAPPHAERIAYVFGHADSTPCGLEVHGERVRLLHTGQGDGSVSWASGRLAGLGDDRHWYMDAEHGALANTARHFGAVNDLLEAGSTARLPQTAPRRRDAERVVAVDAGPVPYPSEEELYYGLLGAHPPRPVLQSAGRELSVGMRAMDLRYAQMPVLCGHCEGDVIAAAEEAVDRHLGGELTRRLQLGLYAEQIGESVVVLDPRRDVEIERGTASGAVVVGLGRLGRLGVDDLRRTVRAGVLAYLLKWDEREHTLGLGREGPGTLSLASLLLGHNSTTEIGIEASIDAVVLGVCEANRQFAETVDSRWQVTRLEFIELFLDSAISAAYALRELPERLGPELAAQGARVKPDVTVAEGPGVRERLFADGGFGYWPQLRITDADGVTEDCGPECYDTRLVTPIPRQAWEAAARAHGFTPPAGAAAAGEVDALTGLHLAERLQFELTAARARVSRVRDQRQPGLVERLVEKSIGDTTYRADFARTLYQLLVPVDFKPFLRERDRLVLQVDEYTANIPWEMLVVDGDPLVRRTRLVRKFITSRGRPRQELPGGLTALVVGDPLTAGFGKVFGGTARDEPASLPGARDEAKAVIEVLEQKRFRVETSIGDDNLTVFNRLFTRPYRIVHIAAHGVFAQPGLDGVARTGVVLSDGTLLTAAEIGKLDYSPDFVFLNCCHLGNTGALPSNANRLAYSVARELIDMDVRCVVVAGWAVDDTAAKTFAQTFYRHFLLEEDSFGEAVHAARRATLHQHGATNTWGAYQAYGDAGFVMGGRSARRHGGGEPLFASQRELHAELQKLLNEASHLPDEDPLAAVALAAAADRLLARASDVGRDLPRTQYLLGMLYRQLGEDFLAQTRTALERSLRGDSRGSGLPLAALQQLANAETTHAEWLAAHGRPDEAMALIEAALARLDKLAESAGRVANTEHDGLLGSAWKRKALLLARAAAPLSEIDDALRHAQDAYERSLQASVDGKDRAWGALNRLQLQALLLPPREAARHAAEARSYAQESRDRFVTSLDYFDAITDPDAMLAEHMLDGSLASREKTVIGKYREVMERMPGSRRQWSSVVRQHRLLADLAGARGLEEMAASLARIAEALSPDVGRAAAHDPAPAAGAGQPQARKKTPARQVTKKKTAARKKSAPASKQTPAAGGRKKRRGRS